MLEVTAFASIFLVSHLMAAFARADSWTAIPLQSKVDRVQPMTGIVLWTDNEHNRTDAIQLEYSYMAYDKIVTGKDAYDWSTVDQLLDEARSRGHQAILRFYFVYPGKSTTVPAYIKALSSYRETQGVSEGAPTGFPDWTSDELQAATLDFYTAFAKRYDRDPRLAFLQTGFGLWSEYHIYDGPFKLGQTFPSKEFQARFLKHLDATFVDTPWMISIDAADGDYSPLEDQPDLLKLKFGVFDDSFLCKQHPSENGMNWKFFGARRCDQSPGGGEFSYYNKKDQRLALAAQGPNGTSFESMAAQYHVSFMIGSDQPNYQTTERIREAGIAIGYRFKITQLQTNGKQTQITVENVGIAPMYHDAFVAVDGMRATQSLKGLLPGAPLTCTIDQANASPRITIESDRLVTGQTIQFDADLR